MSRFRSQMTIPEKTHELWEIPFDRPCDIYSASKHVDQEWLQGLALDSPLSRDNLVMLLELAIGQKSIRAVRARVPDGRHMTFVDLMTLQDEFQNFMSNAKNRQLARKLQLANRKQARRSPRTLISDWQRSILYAMVGEKRLLPVVEQFYTQPEHWIQLASRSPFLAFQIREEIASLLDLVGTVRPKSVLEVGTCRGGTLYLFSKVADPSATLLSMDLNIRHRALLESFARNRQHVILLEGDSKAPETVATVRKVFPQGVDFLFLDGDHSYVGIKQDFEKYSLMVRPGGLITFHDIVPDNESRFGVITGGWSGGVPQFWSEIKSAYKHLEFVKSYNQDGAGIGVLFTPETAGEGNEVQVTRGAVEGAG